MSIQHFAGCHVRICLTIALLAACPLTVSSASNYSLLNCRLLFPKKDATHSVHPVFEQQGDALKFLPYLRVRLMASVQTYRDRMSGVVHYFSQDGKPIATEDAFPVARGQKVEAFPNYLQRGKPDHVFFKIQFDARKKWYAVILIGDKDDKAVTTWPQGTDWRKFDFPEKTALLSNASRRMSDDIDPVEEFAFDTGLSAHPRITFMLRKPKTARSFSGTKGVLALCLLANSVGEVKDRLQSAAINDDLTGVLAYAERRNLVVVCWSAWKYWNPNANWDGLGKTASRGISDASRENATAWARGMKSLSVKYRLPPSGYLLCGFSGSAQFAIRLAMRRPELFKAVYAHIPSSFPKPKPIAQKVLWCLTTGELEVGYDRSIAFLDAAQAAGYSIIYKAIPGLGHSSHPQADRICEAFFDYATGISTMSIEKVSGQGRRGDLPG